MDLEASHSISPIRALLTEQKRSFHGSKHRTGTWFHNVSGGLDRGLRGDRLFLHRLRQAAFCRRSSRFGRKPIRIFETQTVGGKTRDRTDAHSDEAGWGIPGGVGMG